MSLLKFLLLLQIHRMERRSSNVESRSGFANVADLRKQFETQRSPVLHKSSRTGKYNAIKSNMLSVSNCNWKPYN